MKLPTVQAYELMEGQFDWINEIYQMNIPKEIIGNTDKTICLISESANTPMAYANRMFKQWLVGVEVQIFYKEDSGIDSLDNELALARLFKNDNWEIDTSRPHSLDPDTGQVTKVFYFEKVEIVKE